MGRLLGGEKRASWTPEPIVPPYPGANMFGHTSVATNPDSALSVPTVWACVTLLANTVASLPLETYSRVGNGVPKRRTDPSIVLNPDPEQTQSEFLHSVMVSLLLRGNAYALMSGTGVGLNLTMLNPDSVIVKPDPLTGAVRYLVGPAGVDATGRMWHVRGMTLPGHKQGLSPIAYAAMTIGLDISARKVGTDLLQGSGLPKGQLVSDMAINQQQAATLKERFEEASRDRRIVALGEGTKFELLPIKAEESQFLKTQEFNIGQIARFFNVPAEKVGGQAGSSLTYSTAEMNDLDFLKYGVGFWLKRIEDAYFPLLPQPQYVCFNTQKLLRTDAKTQAEVDAIRVASKVRAPSEIRTDLGYEPLTQDEKDELSLVPLTVTPNTGMPKALPNPPTQATAADAPMEPPPKQGAKNG